MYISVILIVWWYIWMFTHLVRKMDPLYYHMFYYYTDFFRPLKWVLLSTTIVQMDNCTETRLMFDNSAIKLLRDFDWLAVSSISQQPKTKIHEELAPSSLDTVMLCHVTSFRGCVGGGRHLQQQDFISESVSEVWRRPPKSNKHQGYPLESWPEAPVCSWEWRQTLRGPSVIWDKEHTNKAWIYKQCGKLFDTRGNTALLEKLSFLLRALWAFFSKPLKQSLVENNHTAHYHRCSLARSDGCIFKAADIYSFLCLCDIFTRIWTGCVASPVGCWADVDFSGLAARFKLVGQRDIVPEKAVAWHLHSDYASQHWTSVQAYTHLWRSATSSMI